MQKAKICVVITLVLLIMVAIIGFLLPLFNKNQKDVDYTDLKLCCIGDSITLGLCMGEQMDNPYPSIVAKNLGLKEVYNLGIGGSTISSGSYSKDAMVNRYTEIPVDADIIVLNGGVNDWAKNKDLGNISDSSPTTIYGALNCIAIGLKYNADYKDAFVVFTSPFPVSDLKLEQYSTTPYSLSAVANAIKEVAEKYNIAFLDFYKQSGFENYCNNEDLTDGVHPFPDFHKNVIAPLLTDFIKDNYAEWLKNKW